MRRVLSVVVAGLVAVAAAAPGRAAPTAAQSTAPTLTAAPAWQPLPAWAEPLIRQLQFGWSHLRPSAVPGPQSLPAPAPSRQRGYTCFIAQGGGPCGAPARPLPVGLP